MLMTAREKVTNQLVAINIVVIQNSAAKADFLGKCSGTIRYLIGS